LVCENGYYPSSAGTCTVFETAAVNINEVILSSPITGCTDGFFLDANVGSSTIGKCVACGANVAKCKNTLALFGATLCNAGYTVTLGVCTRC